MRRLAQSLGSEVMSLYYYVQSKDALLDDILDAVSVRSGLWPLVRLEGRDQTDRDLGQRDAGAAPMGRRIDDVAGPRSELPDALHGVAARAASAGRLLS